MKEHIKYFCMRGLLAASGGPVVLAIVYGILGATGEVQSLSVFQVTMGILSVTLMAFIAAGITVVYTIEKLPLLSAILIHAGVLYADYLIMYLLNDWMPRNLSGIGIFTAIFVGGYALIWLGIWLITRAKTAKLNKKLRAQ